MSLHYYYPPKETAWLERFFDEDDTTYLHHKDETIENPTPQQIEDMDRLQNELYIKLYPQWRPTPNHYPQR